ncbi:4-phosphopantetheinyl transferase [Streptomyces globosus]|uniref:4-phosphopantetheinyl transferase n=1 Tax=Streptomyces globosus TaxID=68209 RepID=A0A344TZM9_9ACTN|nr:MULTISPECIES: 4'-phosphopantetheinyl transferase superfamily protein [Streptomyces]AXE24100.1 4-phosphopantetheinyl transferase [Streptomyces globosus]
MDEPRVLDLRHPPRTPPLPSCWLVTPDAQSIGELLAPRTLDAAEQRTAAAFHSEQEGLGYMTAHVALRTLLGAALGRAPEAIRLVRRPCPDCGGPHGRPAVGGSALHFSLARTGGLALIALAARPVGVDIERVPDPDTAERLASELHPRERHELAALPAGSRPGAVARIWVRKEAHSKGLGIGLARPLDLDYVGAGPPPRLAEWQLHDLAAPAGHRAALASATP